jgi:Cdc6-like AAA superfamily ATPase
MSNKKRNRFIKKAKQIFTQQRILLITGLCFLFFFTLSWQIQFIGKYLSKPKEVFPPFIQDLLLLVSLGWSIYWLLKILKGYRVSFSQWLVAAIILSISLYYYYFEKQEFDFHRLFSTEIPQLLLLWIPTIVFSIIAPISNIISLWSVYKNPENETLEEILTDQKLEDFEASSPHKRVGEKLAKDIINQKNSAALSLGLTGPWGNGKSSVLNFVKKELQKENANIKRQKLKNLFRSHNKKLKDLLVLEFSPYRNHNENEVAQEFFLMLSNSLSNYHGKLGPLLLVYAQKLTNLYTKKDLAGFLAKPVSSLQSKSAEELYTTIDGLLRDLGKKVVILVDDLDRLRTTEILEVLKLLRNTADFHNLIFVVAMDKEYVVRRLKDQGEISNARFIDKFFQLEFYLPEIRKENLQEEFKKLVDSYIDTSSEFKMSIENALQHPNSLFDEYCTNYRDVKRLANQVRLEYSWTGKECDLKDFINFTCFKIRFPQVLSYINQERNEVLKIGGDNKTLVLEENTSERQNLSKKLLTASKLKKIYKIFDESKNLFEMLQIEKIEEPLVIKSIAYLFGNENKPEAINSIRNITILRSLMEQRVEMILVSQQELNDLMSLTEDLRIMAFFEGKNIDSLRDIFKLFEYYQGNNKDYIVNGIQKLTFLVRQNELTEFTTIKKLLFLLERFLKIFLELNLDPSEKERLQSLLRKNIFESTQIKPETKSTILWYVYKRKEFNKGWTLDEKDFKNYAENYFKDFLKEYEDDIWKFDNGTWIVMYNDLKNISDCKSNINELFKKFWTERNSEILCLQLLDIKLDNQIAYWFSDIVKDVFESYANYVTFARGFDNENLNAYFDFVKLAEITEFNYYPMLYDFRNWNLMLRKKEHALKELDDNFKNGIEHRIQLFFETNSNQLLNDLDKNKEIAEGILLYDFKIHELEEKYYLVLKWGKAYAKSEYFDKIVTGLKNELKSQNWQINNMSLSEVKEGKPMAQKDGYYFKLISYQP